MNTMHTIPQKRLDECYDLAVVGGGLAGVMTAVAAAREGKRVILLEKYGCLGGMATAGLVYPFMRHSEKPSGRPANKGLYFRLLKEIYEIGGSDGEESRHYKEEFMKGVAEYGKELESRMAELKKSNKCLRYIASFNNGNASIGLAEVEANHPFFHLDDSNNIIMIYSERYKEHPMTIRGYGAGAEVTAAGVFADIMKTTFFNVCHKSFLLFVFLIYDSLVLFTPLLKQIQNKYYLYMRF